MGELRIGIITCSDTRSQGKAEDTAGLGLAGLCEDRGWLVVAYHLDPDEIECVCSSIIEMIDVDGADVVLTCGGTGFGPRDITPEATEIVCDRMAPGVAEHIRAESLKITPRAMLSRGIAALRGTALVVNLPGSERASREAFGFIAGQLEHARDMANGGGH